jgi:hypothetical protein
MRGIELQRARIQRFRFSEVNARLRLGKKWSSESDECE